MKNILLAFLCVTIISCQPKDLPTVVDIQSDYALVKISHMTTKAELEKIKNDLKTITHLDFEYGASTFFEDGKLKTLAYGIKGNIGSGSATADLMSIQFHYYGLIYDPGGNPSLRVGSM